MLSYIYIKRLLYMNNIINIYNIYKYMWLNSSDYICILICHFYSHLQFDNLSATIEMCTVPIHFSSSCNNSFFSSQNCESHKMNFEQKDRRSQVVRLLPDHRATNPILQYSLKSTNTEMCKTTNRIYQHFSAFTVLAFPQ